jgi:hypothetical protein
MSQENRENEQEENGEQSPRQEIPNHPRNFEQGLQALVHSHQGLSQGEIVEALTNIFRGHGGGGPREEILNHLLANDGNHQFMNP